MIESLQSQGAPPDDHELSAACRQKARSEQQVAALAGGGVTNHNRDCDDTEATRQRGPGSRRPWAWLLVRDKQLDEGVIRVTAPPGAAHYRVAHQTPLEPRRPDCAPATPRLDIRRPTAPREPKPGRERTNECAAVCRS